MWAMMQKFRIFFMLMFVFVSKQEGVVVNGTGNVPFHLPGAGYRPMLDLPGLPAVARGVNHETGETGSRPADGQFRASPGNFMPATELRILDKLFNSPGGV
jgi:hypothetical protein